MWQPCLNFAVCEVTNGCPPRYSSSTDRPIILSSISARGGRIAMPHIQKVTQMHIIGIHRPVQTITVNGLPSLVVTLQFSLPPVLMIIFTL